MVPLPEKALKILHMERNEKDKQNLQIYLQQISVEPNRQDMQNHNFVKKKKKKKKKSVHVV